MTNEELDIIVEAKLEAELAARLEADRQRVKMEVVDQIRRKAEREWYARINKKHPIEDKYGGLGPEGHAARLAAMDAARVADKEWHDRVNSRPVEGSLLYNKQRADSAGGSAGFEIRPVRRS